MEIEQIRMNQTKALPPASQFNWSQMESSPLPGMFGNAMPPVKRGPNLLSAASDLR